MSRSAPALITPELLVWARETIRLTHETASEKLGIDPLRLSEWESGKSRPSIAQLRKIATAYKRPFSAFYLPERPLEEGPPHDYRRIHRDEELISAAELAFAIQQATFRREAYLDLYDGHGAVGAFDLSGSMAAGVEAMASRIRTALRISLETQVQWEDKRIAFNGWRRAIERIGTLVFLFQNVDEREARGFSISHDVLPVIGINSADATAGRTFTLFHELVHLMLRKSGVCDIYENFARHRADQSVEVFCNAVAGVALVPTQDFEDFVQEAWTNRSDLDGLLARIAARYKVSEAASLRRLYTCKFVSKSDFEAKHDLLVAEYFRLKEERRSMRKDVKIGVGTKVLSALGMKYTGVVLRSYGAGKITLSDVVDYIGTKAPHISKIKRTYEERLMSSASPD